MKVTIRTGEMRLSLPVPMSQIGFVVKLLPNRLFEKAARRIPRPYSALVSKEAVGMILSVSQGILKDNKGLEVLRVEGADGDFISLRL